MDTFNNYLVVGLGSALGGIGRVMLTSSIARKLADGTTWGALAGTTKATLLVNVTGSFLIGIFVAATGPEGRWPASSRAQLFFVSGVCGGYTTFSSFSLQTLQMAREGHLLHAGANIVASVVICLAAVFAGHFCGSLLSR